ncbi:MAG: hypothetical protein LIO87_09695 [Eubacterium sp.]|nr:hypothetical protein [Eubacterium sp.]
MVSRVITRTNGNKKVIDFRDNLNLSALDDYAELHGNGGKNHAVKSTIKCCMCDFSKGTGGNSINVSTNLDIDLVYRLKALSEQFLFGSKEYEIDASGLSNLKQAIAGLEKISKLISESKPIDKNAIEWVKGKVTDGIKAV